jgi:hypothetical protein
MLASLTAGITFLVGYQELYSSKFPSKQVIPVSSLTGMKPDQLAPVMVSKDITTEQLLTSDQNDPQRE